MIVFLKTNLVVCIILLIFQDYPLSIFFLDLACLAAAAKSLVDDGL